MTAAAFAEPWELTPEERHRCDPLLDCLAQITGLLGKPWSTTALTAGLPLAGEGLTPELFVRAADRAGLSARVVQRPLKDIPLLGLPAVLLLKDRQACVLTARDDVDCM